MDAPVCLPPKLVAAELELTTRCPYRCMTCGSAAGEARARELTLEEWSGVITDLKSLGCKQLTFLGGEPLCFQGWPELARHAADLGIGVEIVTSGVQVNQSLAERIRASGVGSVTVSVDGTEVAHDQQRGVPGSYRQALQAIRCLDRAGLHVGVATQVNSLSLPTLEELAAELQEAGAIGWQVQLTFPMGRARASQIVLGPERMPELYALLQKLSQRRGLRPALTDNLGYWTRDDILLRTPQGGRARPWLGCLAGIRHLGITSDGTVKGCLALAEGFAEGNLRAEPLARIWGDPARFAFSRGFQVSQLSGPCRDCPHGSLCRGGCTALAVAHHSKPGVCTHCFRACIEPLEETATC